MCFQLPPLLGDRGTPAENCSEKSPCTRVMGASTGASAPPPPSRCRRGAQKRQQNEKRRAPPAGASGPRGWRGEIIGDRRGLHRCLLRRVTAPHSSRPATPRSCPEAASSAAERAAAPLVTAPAPLRVRPPSRPHSPLLCRPHFGSFPPCQPRLRGSLRPPPGWQRPAQRARLGSLRRGGRQAAERRL